MKICDVGSADFHDFKTDSISIRGTIPFMAPELIKLIYDQKNPNLFT